MFVPKVTLSSSDPLVDAILSRNRKQESLPWRQRAYLSSRDTRTLRESLRSLTSLAKEISSGASTTDAPEIRFQAASCALMATSGQISLPVEAMIKTSLALYFTVIRDPILAQELGPTLRDSAFFLLDALLITLGADLLLFGHQINAVFQKELENPSPRPNFQLFLIKYVRSMSRKCLLSETVLRECQSLFIKRLKESTSDVEEVSLSLDCLRVLSHVFPEFDWSESGRVSVDSILNFFKTNPKKNHLQNDILRKKLWKYIMDLRNKWIGEMCVNSLLDFGQRYDKCLKIKEMCRKNIKKITAFEELNEKIDEKSEESDEDIDENDVQKNANNTKDNTEENIEENNEQNTEDIGKSGEDLQQSEDNEENDRRNEGLAENNESIEEITIDTSEGEEEKDDNDITVTEIRQKKVSNEKICNERPEDIEVSNKESNEKIGEDMTDSTEEIEIEERTSLKRSADDFESNELSKRLVTEELEEMMNEDDDDDDEGDIMKHFHSDLYLNYK